MSKHFSSDPQLEEQLPKGTLKPPRPDYIFRLQYVAEQEARFQRLATPHGTFHAFHGSSVERFHSILHNGLLNMFNKVVIDNVCTVCNCQPLSVATDVCIR